MPNDILIERGTLTAFTITTASLAAAGGRSTASVDNSTAEEPAAIISAEITSGGSAPTAGGVYSFYLLSDDNDGSDPIRTDNWAGTDASFTRENAPLLGTIVVTNDTAKEFRGHFDTAPLGPLAPKWGVALVNDTDQAISSTEADCFIRYQTYHPEVQ